MKIKIYDDASRRYINRCVIAYKMTYSQRWADLLSKVEGKWLDVETEFLFKDQFNTVPVPGVSNSGLRIMIESVSEIIDDIRPFKMRCNWCGKCSDVAEVCTHCGKSEYLEKPIIKGGK